MANRNTSSRETRHPASQALPPDLTEAAREQLASTAAAASRLLRFLEGMQQAQYHWVQRAALLQEQTAQRLRQADSPAEWMAIQSHTALTGWGDFAGYAQELMTATFKAQDDMARAAEPGAASVEERRATTAAQAAAATGMGPLFQAWEAMFNVPLNAGMHRPH